MSLRTIKMSVINIDLRVPMVRLPIHYLNFKNYYTKNGKYPDNVIWQEPILNYEGWHFDEIVDYYDKQDSDVYSFSCYLWSHVACMAIGKALKERNPKRIIIMGGPHLNITHNKLDWFFNNRFVDAICEPTSYGEWFVTDMLNGLVEDNLKWKNVSFSIYRTGRGPTPNKRDFTFPGPLIPGNEDILFKCKDLALQRDVPLTLPIELTRGCPYECVFCEWGGGIGGKVVRKSLQDIKADLDYIPQIGIQEVQILDANYGIYKEDVQVSEHIEKIKKTFGYPNYVEIYGMTKSKPEARWETIEPLARAGAVDRYKLSLQTLNQDVLSHIKRTDIPRDKDFEFAEYLYKTYGVRADLEFIMGLPGFTRRDFYEEIDVHYKYGYTLERYTWLLLPDSPAYDPEYKQKYGIQSIVTCLEHMGLHNQYFEDVSAYQDYYITSDRRFVSDVELVVQAEGYTRQDFVEFFFLNFWLVNNVKFGLVEEIVEYNVQFGRKPSEFFERVYAKLTEPSNNKYAKSMKRLIEEIEDLVYGRRSSLYEYKMFNLPFTDKIIEINYIHKVCAYVFKDDYVSFIKEVAEDLGLQLPEHLFDDLDRSISGWRNTLSKKYDKFIHAANYYETAIKNVL